MEIEVGGMHRRFDGARDTVGRKPSRTNHETGHIFQLRKAKEKSSGALRKFRESGAAGIQINAS